MHPTDDALNEFVDDGLSRAERADVESHLAGCAECRRTVEDLRALRTRASSLEPMAPPAGAWQRIERELRRPAGASRWPLSRRTMGWLAAAAILALSTIVGVRYAPWRRTPAPPAARAELAMSVQSELMQAEEHYQKAIAGLEQIANAEKGALDPQTAATVEKSMAAIDQAITESRTALKSQPNSEPAQESLLENFKTKIAFLQDTISLINEMRKGNDAGAAKIVSGLNKKS